MKFDNDTLHLFKMYVEHDGLTPTAATRKLGYSKRYMRELAALAGLSDYVNRPVVIDPSVIRPLNKLMAQRHLRLGQACRLLNLTPSQYNKLSHEAADWGIKHIEYEQLYGPRLAEIEGLLKQYNATDVARLIGAKRRDRFIGFLRRHDLGHYIKWQPPSYTLEQRELAMTMWKNGAKLREIAQALSVTTGRESDYTGFSTLLRRWLGADFVPRNAKSK